MRLQSLVSGSPTAEKQLAHLLYGVPFVGAGWAFGDVVEMVNPAMSVPEMATPTMRTPGMADPSMETT